MKLNSEIQPNYLLQQAYCQCTVSSSTVFNEDCSAVMARYPDGYFDLAVCDVPYGIGVAKKKHYGRRSHTKAKHSKNNSTAIVKRSDYTPKSWDNETPGQEYFDELKRISKHQIIFGIEYMEWQGVGSGRIKWDKGVAEGVSFNRYEIAYCSLIDDEWTIPILWTGMLQAKSLAEPMTQQGNKKLNEKRIHPCHKPVLLYDAIYLKFGFEGMKVIDTHLGGGSNRISCDKLGYEFVGCEIDQEYFIKQENRFKQHTSQLRISGW